MKKSELKSLIKEVMNSSLKTYKVTQGNERAVEDELRKKGVKDADVKPGQEITAEDLDIGHIDDEPGMLKQTAYDIAQYAARLYKMLKQYEQMPTEVDFPHWWQTKVEKAKEYISKATHYLEFETQEPAIDAMALQEDASMGKTEAVMELTNILDELQMLGNQAKDIIAQHFPSELRRGEAYGVFDIGHSSNRYDVTLASIIADIEEYGGEDMMEGEKRDPSKTQQELDDEDAWIEQAIKDWEEMEANRYAVPMRDDEELGITTR